MHGRSSEITYTKREMILVKTVSVRQNIYIMCEELFDIWQ